MSILEIGNTKILYNEDIWDTEKAKNKSIKEFVVWFVLAVFYCVSICYLVLFMSKVFLEINIFVIILLAFILLSIFFFCIGTTLIFINHVIYDDNGKLFVALGWLHGLHEFEAINANGRILYKYKNVSISDAVDLAGLAAKMYTKKEDILEVVDDNIGSNVTCIIDFLDYPKVEIKVKNKEME